MQVEQDRQVGEDRPDGLPAAQRPDGLRVGPGGRGESPVEGRLRGVRRADRAGVEGGLADRPQAESRRGDSEAVPQPGIRDASRRGPALPAGEESAVEREDRRQEEGDIERGHEAGRDAVSGLAEHHPGGQRRRIDQREDQEDAETVPVPPDRLRHAPLRRARRRPSGRDRRPGAALRPAPEEDRPGDRRQEERGLDARARSRQQVGFEPAAQDAADLGDGLRQRSPGPLPLPGGQPDGEGVPNHPGSHRQPRGQRERGDALPPLHPRPAGGQEQQSHRRHQADAEVAGLPGQGAEDDDAHQRPLPTLGEEVREVHQGERGEQHEQRPRQRPRGEIHQGEGDREGDRGPDHQQARGDAPPQVLRGDEHRQPQDRRVQRAGHLDGIEEAQAGHREEHRIEGRTEGVVAPVEGEEAVSVEEVPRDRDVGDGVVGERRAVADPARQDERGPQPRRAQQDEGQRFRAETEPPPAPDGHHESRHSRRPFAPSASPGVPAAGYSTAAASPVGWISARQIQGAPVRPGWRPVTMRRIG